MKILVFSPYYPPHIGGVEFFARDLHQHLNQRGIEITVFTPHLPPATLVREQSQEATIIRFPAWEPIHNYPLPKYWPFFWTPGFWRSFKSLWQEQPDIVISHTRFFSTSLLALIYAKMRKIPLLHIEHGSSFVQSSNYFITAIAKIYDLTFGKIIIKKANSLVAISLEAKNFISQLYPNKPCQIIHRGFDRETVEKIIENTTLLKKPNIVRIIYIGRLISGKGVHVLLNALKKMSSKNWELLIIGDGPERASLESLALETDKAAIKFLGEKPWEEAIALLKTADIFVNPSFSEGLPTTVAEAALCEKSIVATNVGSTKDLFPDSLKHFLVLKNDPIDLSEKISHLIQNSELRVAAGNRLLKHIQESFSWKQSTDDFLKLLRTLTNK